MENIKQLQDGLFTIYAFIDGAYRLQEGLASNISIDEVKEKITNLGLDADKMLFSTHPYRAMQEICKIVAELDITDSELENYSKEV